ncbi:AMP-binding protein [Desulfatiglans anilini]|uniref:AMP-binding protein n=1 Tax=Desulfatiglans anilini TaxID=90728 RepID=UPI00041CC45C|nr:AMP-binding protein [Desulfatiglans anilini]
MSDSANMARERVQHALLERQAAKYGDRTFLYFNEKEYSFNDLNRMANRAASGFQKAGIEKGDKVAIIMDNSPEFLFVWFGLSKLGAIEVPLNTAHKGDILTYMADQSDSHMIVMNARYLDRVLPILGDLPKVETLVLLGGEADRPPAGGKRIVDWASLVDNDGLYEPADVVWSDPQIIMYTSGTTGPSKGSLLPQNYGIYMAECICDVTSYTEEDCLYNALPLFHGNAQVLSTLPAMLSGARMVLCERFSASRFWDDIGRYRCTEFNYIGGILPILYKADPRPDDADNPLRIMVGGGAPMDLFDAFEKRFGVTLLEGYGMSEIGIPLQNTIGRRKPGTCGRCRSDYTVKVVDDDQSEVGPNTPGEVLLRPLKPYCIFLEYYNMPEKTVEAWRDLWFHTGDYLYCDEDGYFHFVDRKKDALRRRGENISSYEVEKVINSHPSVLESAAVAVKSDLGEDEVMIVITLKPGKALSPEELMAYCQERMAYFMVPRYVRFMAAMPKTPTQRVQKNLLRDQGVTSDTWDREKAGYKVKR